MNFTQEQITGFVKNWREFQKAGKHKRQLCTLHTEPPQINYLPSDLTCVYHILYSYFRNLPLDRGITGTYDEKRDIIRDAALLFWWIDNKNYQYAWKQYIDVFGEGITVEVVKQFKDIASAY